MTENRHMTEDRAGTGFDIVDRYDAIASLLISALAIGALLLGAPLWAAALILIAGWTGLFVRHFDQIMGP